MKKTLSLLVAAAITVSMFCGFAFSSSAAMTAPTLGEDGNVVVWNLTGAAGTNIERTQVQPDGSVRFRDPDGRVHGNEVIHQGRINSANPDITNEALPAGKYYLKLLYKTQKSDDEAVAKGSNSANETTGGRIRLFNDVHLDFGTVDKAKDGQWQSAVVEFNVTAGGREDVEMVFWSNWIGAYFDFYISQYVVISSDPTDLVSEYENEPAQSAPRIEGGVMEKPIVGQKGVIKFWDISQGGNELKKNTNNSFYSNFDRETVWGKEFSQAEREGNIMAVGSRYYLKFLVRVDYPDDATKTSHDFDGVPRADTYDGNFGTVRDWGGSMHGFGGGDQGGYVKTYDRAGNQILTEGAESGVWQSIVIEIEHYYYNNTVGEMAFWNVYRGQDIRLYFGQYMTVSTNDAPLAIDYTDGAYEIPVKQTPSATASQWWNLSERAINGNRFTLETGAIGSDATNETFWSIELSNGNDPSGARTADDLILNETYYLKFLVKVTGKDDPAKTPNTYLNDFAEVVGRDIDPETDEPDGAYGLIRDVSGNTHRFGQGINEDEWISVVLPFEYSGLAGDAANGEMALFNVYTGGSTKVYYGGILELSDDATPLEIPAEWIDDVDPPEAEVQDVIDAIDALPEAGDVVIGDRTAIYAAYDMYNTLSEENKALVTNYQKLEDAKRAVDLLKNPGDLNDDNKILANDAVLLLQELYGATKPAYINRVNADINGDGKILANDAVLLLQYLYGPVDQRPF